MVNSTIGVDNLELSTVIYHLNSYAQKHNIDLEFSDDVTPKPNIKFKVIKQQGTVLTIEVENNEELKDTIVGSNFKFGKENIIINKVKKLSNRQYLININRQSTISKRTYEIGRDKLLVLVKNGYRWNNSENGSLYKVTKRINFGVSIDLDPNGELFENVMNFVEKAIETLNRSLRIYDMKSKEVLKNKYIRVTSNVNTSEFIDNLDNIHRGFYILVESYNNK